MCYPVPCRTCGKTGWAGCGQHVDEVMRTVPASERCSCRPDPVSGGQDRAARRADLGTRFR
ncbi:hypothetical protein [Mycobacterium sp. MMS18-G62]